MLSERLINAFNYNEDFIGFVICHTSLSRTHISSSKHPVCDQQRFLLYCLLLQTQHHTYMPSYAYGQEIYLIILNTPRSLDRSRHRCFFCCCLRIAFCCCLSLLVVILFLVSPLLDIQPSKYSFMYHQPSWQIIKAPVYLRVWDLCSVMTRQQGVRRPSPHSALSATGLLNRKKSKS